MPYSKDRRKLKRLLGKTLRYYGIFEITDAEKKIFLIKNVTYNNKLMTDHVWYRPSESVTTSPKESEVKVSFFAEAVAYEDSKGNKKYGLEKIHNVVEEQKIIEREHTRFWHRKKFKGNK